MVYYSDTITQGLTLSYTVSKEDSRGDIEHNLRLRHDGTVRQRGYVDRHEWNVYLDVRVQHDHEIVNVLNELWGDKLAAYNEKHLRAGKPGRCVTMEEWYMTQRKSKHSDNLKRGYEEVLIEYGDRLSACPFIYQTDSQGRPIDKDGNAIEPWETDKPLVPIRDKNGKPVKSARYQTLVNGLIAAHEAFKAENPEFVILAASIHADEGGGIHMHVNYLPTYELKQSIGHGIAPTTCYQRICKRLGIKFSDSKDDCAAKHWTTYMRDNVVPRVMQECGFFRVDGGCQGQEHKSVPKYKIEQDRKCEQFRQEVAAARAEIKAQQAAIDKRAAAVMEAEAAALKRLKEVETAKKAADTARREAETLKQEAATAKQKAASLQTAVQEALDDATEKKRAGKEYMDRWQKRENEASTEKTRYQEKLKQLQSQKRVLDTRQREYDRVASIERELAEKEWIIAKVEAEHPEWLRDAKNTYRTEIERPVLKRNQQKGKGNFDGMYIKFVGGKDVY